MTSEVASAQVVLPPTPKSAAAARTVLGTLMQVWDCDDPERVAELLTSEVVTNVIRHAGTRLTLDVRLQQDILRVAVTDGQAAYPAAAPASRDSECGRGLPLLDVLSSAWGVEPLGIGKTVWFEVAAPTSKDLCS